jgi:hypothetical protein
MRRFVMIVTSTPRARAERRAESTGGEVRLGVRIWMCVFAVLKRCNNVVFRGVGGGAGAASGQGRKRGLRWWGEGRSVVSHCMLCLLEVEGGDEVEMGKGGRSFRPQVSRQKERREGTMGPERWMQHSSQDSQLRLQLGRIACWRSMRMNFGCSTLTGRKKMLLTWRSRPCSFEGLGRWRWEAHVEGW